MKKDKNSARRQRTLKYLNIGLSVLCVISLLSSGVVFAISSNVLPVDNVFQTDKVDIALTNNTLTRENKIKEIDSDTPIEVLPGKIISLIPTIENKGADSYIRAFVYLNEHSGLNLNDLGGISKQWQYNPSDGYFYYKDLVKSDEVVKLYDTLNIPTDYDRKDIKYDVKVSVDAIQARNFTPDFTSTTPWGNVEIKDYTDSGVYQYQKVVNPTKAVNITYNGKSNELISNKKDFFSDLPKLVPGDTYKNTITLYNNFDKEVKLYFEGHPDRDISIPNDLLEKISLKITRDDGTVLFDGKLSNDIENKEIISLKSQETRHINYEIQFADDADNAYANIDHLVHWYFNTAFDDKKPDNGPVKTGDTTDAILLFALGIISGLGVIYLREEEENNEESI